jgi:hypothetical protein
MKRTLFYLAAMIVCAAVLSSCLGKGNKAQATDEEGSAVEAVADENVVVLFDGSSTEGWRGYNKEALPSRWSIEDGALKVSGSGTGEGQSGQGGDIIFDRKFTNFELTFEYKVAKGSNSGVFFYAKELPGRPIYISSPEYQVLDNENHPDAKLGKDGNRKSASLYDMIPAVPQNAKPFGEWNTGGIMVYKGTVVHYQNGEAVVEYHLWTPEWNALINASKFREGNPNWADSFELLTSKMGKDDAGNLEGGYIGLQDHGDDVWFRNIKVKILE